MMDPHATACKNLGTLCSDDREDRIRGVVAILPRGLPREHPWHTACHAEIDGFWWVLTG